MAQHHFEVFLADDSYSVLPSGCEVRYHFIPGQRRHDSGLKFQVAVACFGQLVLDQLPSLDQLGKFVILIEEANCALGYSHMTKRRKCNYVRAKGHILPAATD